MADFGPDFYRERDEQGKIARMDRLISTKLDLDNERAAHSYLVDNAKFGAAQRVAENITKLERRVQRFQDELNG